MGIAIFSRSPSVSVLTSPWQALAAFFRPAQPVAVLPPSRSAAPIRQVFSGKTEIAVKPVAGSACHGKTSGQKSCQTVAKVASPRRLKIVREFEVGINPSCAGRMVISGRMADVCAELDRLAQRDAAQAI